MTVEEKDWRLTNQADYLMNVSLHWAQYRRYSERWGHDHCEFCWTKFSELQESEDLRSGYVTENNYHWICEKCFEDFKGQFEWTVGPQPDE